MPSLCSANIDLEEDGLHETLRVRGLADNSGVRAAGRAGVRKWVQEHLLQGQGGRGRWIYDCHIFLPNEATVADARNRLGI